MSSVLKLNVTFSLRKLPSPSLCNKARSIRHNSSKFQCQEAKKPLMTLDCKVAVITGGSEGIGFAIAHQILGDKIKNVALVGLNTCMGRDAVNTLNCCYGKNKAMFIRADVKCPNQLKECFQKIKDEYGRLDVVVNAAGCICGCNWEKEVATNFIGTIRCTLLGLKYMSKEESGSGGVVLNISGTHGLQPLGPAPTLSAEYHGIVGLSRSFGHSLNFQRTGVRVVCLCPGITHTNFLKKMSETAMNEAMAKNLENELRSTIQQKTEPCGKAAHHVLLYGESGSVWTVEGSKLYSLNIPHWKNYSKLVSQFI